MAAATAPAASSSARRPSISRRRVRSTSSTTTGPSASSSPASACRTASTGRPDGAVAYYADSIAGTVTRYPWDADVGRLGTGRVLVAIDPDEGVPDGLTVDDEGCVWLAVWGAGEVRRYDDDGRLLRTLPFPTAHVSSCSFGGAGGDRLFVTTARPALPPTTPATPRPARCSSSTRASPGPCPHRSAAAAGHDDTAHDRRGRPRLDRATPRPAAHRLRARRRPSVRRGSRRGGRPHRRHVDGERRRADRHLRRRGDRHPRCVPRAAHRRGLSGRDAGAGGEARERHRRRSARDGRGGRGDRRAGARRPRAPSPTGAEPPRGAAGRRDDRHAGVVPRHRRCLRDPRVGPYAVRHHRPPPPGVRLHARVALHPVAARADRPLRRRVPPGRRPPAAPGSQRDRRAGGAGVGCHRQRAPRLRRAQRRPGDPDRRRPRRAHRRSRRRDDHHPHPGRRAPTRAARRGTRCRCSGASSTTSSTWSPAPLRR